MGTRNLTCVILDGAFKVAQYGQWDGYPSGQGATALTFLRSLNEPGDDPVTGKANRAKKLRALTESPNKHEAARAKEALARTTVDRWETFYSQVACVRALTKEEVHARWKECGADDSGYVGMDIAARFKDRYPWLSRDCGADILAHVLDGSADGVSLDPDFAKDSLFCEWAYVIDLDKRTFEVFKGFSEKPLDPSERFYGEGKDDGKGYYPVRLVKSYCLDDLPTVDQMTAECDPPDSED